MKLVVDKMEESFLLAMIFTQRKVAYQTKRTLPTLDSFLFILTGAMVTSKIFYLIPSTTQCLNSTDGCSYVGSVFLSN